MIEGLKPYAEYKESGSKWLGRIPSRWEAVSLGRPLVQRIEQNRPVRTKDILSLSLRQGVVPYSEKKSGGNKAKEDLTAYTLAYPGDIVVNSMNVVVGSVGLSKYFGAVSPVYYVLHTRSDKDSILYFDALFQDKTFQQSLWGLGNGILFIQSKTTGKFNTIRMRIPMHALRRVVIPQPSHYEQAAIVRFLDHANRKIDGFISAKRKLIRLLSEQKQAIIHRAVTRGLAPNVPLKPSGIPWLGDIPHHWEIHRAKFLFEKVTPPIPENASQVTCFRDGQVTLRSNRRTTGFTNAIYELGYQGIKPGQLVLHSMDAFAGAIGICDSHGKCSPEYVICEPAMDGVHSPYYARLLRTLALQGLFVALCPSVRQRAPRVRFNDFGGFSLPKPTSDEQQRIVEHIERETLSLNTAIIRTEREIALMQEYRTRLTADIVTGKLDVRDAAVKLPDTKELGPTDKEVSMDDDDEEVNESI